MPVERQVQGVNGSAAAMRVCAAHPETMRDGPKVHAGGLHPRRKAGPVIFVTWRPGSQDPGRFRYGSASYGLVENARKTRDHHPLRASSFQGLHTSRARRTAGQYIVDQHDFSIIQNLCALGIEFHGPGKSLCPGLFTETAKAWRSFGSNQAIDAQGSMSHAAELPSEQRCLIIAPVPQPSAVKRNGNDKPEAVSSRKPGGDQFCKHRR